MRDTKSPTGFPKGAGWTKQAKKKLIKIRKFSTITEICWAAKTIFISLNANYFFNHLTTLFSIRVRSFEGGEG